MQIGSTIQLGESIPAGAFETHRYAKIDSQDTAPASTVTSRGQDQKSVDKSVAFLLCFQNFPENAFPLHTWGILGAHDVIDVTMNSVGPLP